MATCKPTNQNHIDQLTESLRHNLKLLDAVRVRNRELIAEMPKPRPQDPQGTNLFPLFVQLDLHTTLLLLGRLEEHLKCLRRSPQAWAGPLAGKGDAFLSAARSEQMRDLRNVFEHMDNYLTDTGRKPSLKVDPTERNFSAWTGDHHYSVRIFGKEYNVTPILDAADDLRKAL